MRADGDVWRGAGEDLGRVFGDAAFELRYSLGGEAAVRVLAPRGPVAARHAEHPDPPAPWSASARCGAAWGWLLAERPPAEPGEARDVLERAVERHTALALGRLTARRAAMAAELLERHTHALRSDVSSLQAVAEGALAGVFEADEVSEASAQVRAVGEAAQRRLTAARDVMRVLDPAAPRQPEPLVTVLRQELDGAGVRLPLAAVDGERPMTLMPGAGWSACARLLVEALAPGAPLGGEGVAIAVTAGPAGWVVTAGCEGPGEPEAWTERHVGSVVDVGRLAIAAGGAASAARLDSGRLRIALTLPAAPSG
jgi:hypothetical protein